MRKMYSLAVIMLALLILESCRKQDAGIVTQPEAVNYSSKVATEWMHTLQKIVQSENASPPVASRIYAYAAIGLYEAALPGMPGYQSLQGQIAGLSNIPDARMFSQLDHIASANEALYQIATKIFVTLKPENLKTIEDLHKKYTSEAYKRALSETVNSSADFGKMLAAAVLNRANNDNFSNTRSMQYIVPSAATNPAAWAPTGAVTIPLEPYWGELKCFAMENGAACTIKSTLPFSATQGSAFYTQAYEVYTTRLNLTEEQKAIANWWSDGSSQTATPPGHWVAIIDQLADRKHFDLGKAAEVYAMVNIAMADAFISCWDEKYKMNLLRPVTYIRNYIPGASNWSPLLNTPPFPEYPSGHSVASGAAGDILTRLLGNVAFTDSANTYLGYQPRSYNSFTQASDEAAISRLYGGIHYREAIESGVKQGREVSKVVLEKIHLKK